MRPVAEWSVIPTRVLLLCALLAGWILLYITALSGLQEAHSQHQLYDDLRQTLAEGTAPIGGQIGVGKPVALLDIPAAGVHRLVVVEGTTSGMLRSGPGHLRDTPLPGQSGVSVIMGRSAMFGAPFAKIPQLQSGDHITVTTGQGVYKYLVSGVRQNGDPAPAAVSATAGRLTLITATGSGWRAGWAPNSAIYVDALLSGKTSAAPAGRPAAVSKAEQALQADMSDHTYIQIVLALQLALVVAVGGVWSWSRWNRWQVWLGGTPVLLVALWILSSVSTQMLPNLL